MDKLKSIINQQKIKHQDLCEHPNFEKRLKWELIEIEVQDAESYFIDLFESGHKFSSNENNLLVAKLLDLVDKVDLNIDPVTKTGEFPDVDVDYLPIVRDYLKNVWAPQEFGENRVCNIGNYGTFGIKSTLIDMARVHGLDRGEILQITTNIGLKDDDGQVLTFDKALEMYPELKEYCERHPEVAKATQKLLYRNRSMGKHAGGLIICSDRIDNFVPLVRGTDGSPVSAWVEGLHGQDLGPVGLIKFDLLVVSGLYQIACTVRLVKERHNIGKLCATADGWDWSDTSYLNDEKSMQMADKGDLKCIFQYDSEGIRNLVRKSGIDTFEDLVAIVSLYRPGPLQMKMDEAFAKRKKGTEKYDLHPVLEPIVGSTYGVLVYQEQIMMILNAVGKIPLRDCYQVIKAISKKKLGTFAKYKDQFILNGQSVLGKTEKEMMDYWEQIQAFSGYGFNRSHAVAYSYISARQLYLKAHYPLEFYTSTLSNEDGDDKKREYITEALNHNVKVLPLDLNKSKDNFAINEGIIYLGFGNVKGIGEEKAKKIVEHQPYEGFEDFLNRFGTDATVCRALIPLGIFKDGSTLKLYKYWQVYVDHQKTVKDRAKRFQTSCEKMITELYEVLPAEMQKIKFLSPEVFKVIKDYLFMKNIANHESIVKCVTILEKKFMTAWTRFKAKEQELANNLPRLESFKEEEVELADKKVLDLLINKDLAEETYYGFVWNNKIRLSPDYKASQNFDTVKYNSVSNKQPYYRLMGEIQDVQVKTFKSGNGKFANVVVIDDNFEKGRVTFWEDDYERFKSELKKGNLISLQVTPSTGGYQGFNFFAPPKWQRHLVPKDKKLDYRLVLMRKPEE